MNHRPRKRFGQNFLEDLSIISHILDAIHPNPTDNMLEIGPGLGALGGLLELGLFDRDGQAEVGEGRGLRGVEGGEGMGGGGGRGRGIRAEEIAQAGRGAGGLVGEIGLVAAATGQGEAQVDDCEGEDGKGSGVVHTILRRGGS